MDALLSISVRLYNQVTFAMSASMPIEIDSAVTTIILQRPIKQQIHAYENWLKEMVPLAQQAAGHRGVNVIRPHGENDEYTIVLHFSSEADLHNWLESDIRRQMIRKVRPLLHADEKIDVKTGLEFWFTPPASRKAAPAYKQFLLTWSAIFPLSILIPWLLSPFLSALPASSAPLIKPLVTSMVLVGLMTFVIMPRYVRWVARWLYQ